jgi:hypothetical protein
VISYIETWMGQIAREKLDLSNGFTDKSFELTFHGLKILRITKLHEWTFVSVGGQTA